jgi:hypothetical protein
VSKEQWFTSDELKLMGERQRLIDDVRRKTQDVAVIKLCDLASELCAELNTRKRAEGAK